MYVDVCFKSPHSVSPRMLSSHRPCRVVHINSWARKAQSRTDHLLIDEKVGYGLRADARAHWRNMICSILLKEARCNILASPRPIIVKFGCKLVWNSGMSLRNLGCCRPLLRCSFPFNVEFMQYGNDEQHCRLAHCTALLFEQSMCRNLKSNIIRRPFMCATLHDLLSEVNACKPTSKPSKKSSLVLLCCL